MPAPSLQSRIDAFESLARPSPPQILPKSPPRMPSNPLEAPISPTASSFASISPLRTSQAYSRSPSASPPVSGRTSSLIDLKDWVMDDGFPSATHPNGLDVRWNGKPNNLGSLTPSPSPDDAVKVHRAVSISPTSILINLESPPSKPVLIKAPPLPPRKTSYTSLKSVSSSNSISTRNSCSPTPFSLNRRPDNLTIEHTYPPLPRLDAVGSVRKIGHAPASSVSSFQSVSLSSDGGTTDGDTAGSVTDHAPIDREGTYADDLSLDESFEEVSASSIVSPTTAATFTSNWDTQYTPRAPKLPSRPSSRQLNTSVAIPSFTKPTGRPTSVASMSPARRGPPPPPSRSESARSSLISITSDRSSILSTGTATTSRTSMSSTPAPIPKASLTRPTPVPATARKRYETVFAANVLQQHRQASTVKVETLSPFVAKKTRQAAGWRGLSVDLITNPEDHPLKSNRKANGNAGSGTPDQGDDTTKLDGKLDGYIVKLIWSTSRLERDKLRSIWNECDISGDGALDRDAFAKGMWRIDEELRKAQTKSSGTSQNLPRLHSPPPKPTAVKPLLR